MKLQKNMINDYDFVYVKKEF